MGMGNEGREGVAVLLPAGTYRVTKMIEIKQSNVVLRGEGVSHVLYASLCKVLLLLLLLQQLRPPCWPHRQCSAALLSANVPPPGLLRCLPACLQVDTTTLYFPRSLQSVYGNKMAWSYMGGFLT
jgi:hypothetical protein